VGPRVGGVGPAPPSGDPIGRARRGDGTADG
jgi:hypothetical protein